MYDFILNSYCHRTPIIQTLCYAQKCFPVIGGAVSEYHYPEIYQDFYVTFGSDITNANDKLGWLDSAGGWKPSITAPTSNWVDLQNQWLSSPLYWMIPCNKLHGTLNTPDYEQRVVGVVIQGYNGDTTNWVLHYPSLTGWFPINLFYHILAHLDEFNISNWICNDNFLIGHYPDN